AARDRAAQAGNGRRPHTQLESAPGPRQSRPRPSGPSVHGSQAVEIVVDRALSQLGVQYAWGGGDEDGPTLGIRDGGVADSHGDFGKVGFDCSGLMIYAFAGIGVSLPHYSGYQYNAGTRVPMNERARGDMLFWGPNGSQHVALYLGDGKMVEAPESGDVVKVSQVRESGIMPYAVRIVT
ncbi:NlpC/P60 family protein, partial [Nocardia xishanensis]